MNCVKHRLNVAFYFMYYDFCKRLNNFVNFFSVHVQT